MGAGVRRSAVAPLGAALGGERGDAFDGVLAGHEVVEGVLGWLTAATTSGMPRVSSITRSEIRTEVGEP